MRPSTRLVAYLLRDTDCMPLVVAQGILVAAIGIGIAVRSELRRRTR